MTARMCKITIGSPGGANGAHHLLTDFTAQAGGTGTAAAEIKVREDNMCKDV